jgi:catechol 2,3-dioxygenase-like lactoylglutathione lyase family enzyme
MSDAWYSRPVLFVADVERAIEFYTRLLGFEPGFRYEEDGVALVSEVTREDCTLLLDCQQPAKKGHGRMFISLDPEPFARLKAEFEQRGAPVKKGWWGYELMVVEDPDGNELFFPEPGVRG